MDANARIEALEEEVARLTEQVLRLEAALGMEFIAPIEWRLTTHEQRLFGALIARDLLTKDAAMAALYRDFGKDEPEPKIVDVFICKLRAKIRPFDLEILTVWGTGYRLAPDTRAAVAHLLVPQQVAA